MSAQAFGRSPKALIQSQYEEAYKKELERIFKILSKKKRNLIKKIEQIVINQ